MKRYNLKGISFLTILVSLFTQASQTFAYTTPTAGQFLYTLYTGASTIIGGAACWLIGLFCLYETFKMAFKGEYTRAVICLVLTFVVPFIPQELAYAGLTL
jgi:hypothetical protein